MSAAPHRAARLPQLLPLRKRLVDVEKLARPFALEVAVIRDKKHPCYGGRALVAAEDIPAGERLIDYAGQICVELAGVGGARAADVASAGGGGGFNRSSYLLNLYSNPEEGVYIDIDAAHAGNESRFANDYRGTGARAQWLPSWAVRSARSRPRLSRCLRLSAASAISRPDGPAPR